MYSEIWQESSTSNILQYIFTVDIKTNMSIPIWDGGEYVIQILQTVIMPAVSTSADDTPGSLSIYKTWTKTSPTSCEYNTATTYKFQCIFV
jgi:hypothetical protein